MGSCISKGKAGGNKQAKSTVSEANSSDADEKAVRRTPQIPAETKTNETSTLPNMVQIKTTRTPSPKPAAVQTQTQTRVNVSPGDAQTASAPAIATSIVPVATTAAARRSNESESASARSLSPTPAPQPLSPASPSQLNSSPVASVGTTVADRRADVVAPVADRRTDVVAAVTQIAAAAVPTTVAPPKRNGFAVSPEADGNGVDKRPASTMMTASVSIIDAISLERKTTPVGTKAAAVVPSTPPAGTLAERRTASPVDSLILGHTITPADQAVAATPPPPAPTPPPLAPTPPPMPPTPPRGSMATISEDAPLPSPTKLAFGNGRRPGPPRGTFGYTFHTSGPPLGTSRPNSQCGSSPPHSPGEPNFGYFPASAPISRTASPAFGGASKSAPISRAASPGPANEAGRSPDLTMGSMGRTTFGYNDDD